MLSDRGIGYLQFDTRPPGWLYEVKTALPDFLLPRFWRRGIRRIRRDPSELEQAMNLFGKHNMSRTAKQMRHSDE